MLAIVGGVLLIALFPNDVSSAIGGVTVSVGSLILIYEVVMIIFAATNLEGVNHSARLLVVHISSCSYIVHIYSNCYNTHFICSQDIILSVVFAVLFILATLGVLVIAVILLVIFTFGTVVVAIFAVLIVS